MFDTLDFAQDILGQEVNPVHVEQAFDVLPSNRQHLTAIISYQHLINGWDEDGAIAPVHQTVLSALDIALLLTVTGQPIYHTSPGPVGEVMINLRNGTKSAELLAYPGGRNKFVRIESDEIPQQGVLTPESLRETLQWLNR